MLSWRLHLRIHGSTWNSERGEAWNLRCRDGKGDVHILPTAGHRIRRSIRNQGEFGDPSAHTSVRDVPHSHPCLAHVGRAT